MSETWDRRYVLTELGENHNKFWHARVDGSTLVVHFGRVGEAGQRSTKDLGSPERAQKYLATKCREKERKGYTPQRTVHDGQMPVAKGSVAAIARAQLAEGADPETAKLVDFLAARNVHALEGATSIRLEAGRLTTPLGPVTPDGIEEARSLLERMAQAIETRDQALDFPRLVDSYLRIVPRAIGRTRVDPTSIFPTVQRVSEEVAVLDAMAAAVADAAAAAQADAPRLFNCEMAVGDDALHARVERLFHRTLNQRHTSARMRLVRCWTVAIAPADEAFEREGRAVGNLKELWHGTRDANLLSILKTGYVIPKRGGSVAITGRMYGDGIYFSSQSTKSLNYATGFWGGGRGERCFMLLNDVAMGREYRPRGGFSGLPPAGYDSCFAQAGRSGVLNDEMIVYRASQCRPTILCEFK